MKTTKKKDFYVRRFGFSLCSKKCTENIKSDYAFDILIVKFETYRHFRHFREDVNIDKHTKNSYIPLRAWHQRWRWSGHETPVGKNIRLRKSKEAVLDQMEKGVVPKLLRSRTELWKFFSLNTIICALIILVTMKL